MCGVKHSNLKSWVCCVIFGGDAVHVFTSENVAADWPKIQKVIAHIISLTGGMMKHLIRRRVAT